MLEVARVETDTEAGAGVTEFKSDRSARNFPRFLVKTFFFVWVESLYDLRKVKVRLSGSWKPRSMSMIGYIDIDTDVSNRCDQEREISVGLGFM